MFFWRVAKKITLIAKTRVHEAITAQIQKHLLFCLEKFDDLNPVFALGDIPWWKM